MNAEYIYEIFEANERNDAHDLYVGLAHLRTQKPIPEGMTDRGIREFLGRHYKALTKAYQAKDRVAFAATVAKCEAEDAEQEETGDE